MFIKVVFPVVGQGGYTYLPPDQGEVQPGWPVLVPLGKSQRVGVVWQLLAENDCSPEVTLRPILRVLAEQAILDDKQIVFLTWMTRYYMHPLGSAAAVALPSHLLRYEKGRQVRLGPDISVENLNAEDRSVVEVLRQSRRGLAFATLLRRLGGGKGWASRLERLGKRGILSIEERWHFRESRLAVEEPSLGEPSPPLVLNREQAEVLQVLVAALREGRYGGFLLEGVTGAGKTEIYLQASRQAVDLGRQVLILIPEIALTPQMAARFHARFPGLVALFHSGMQDNLRYHHWLRVKEGAARVVIGARSALFAPFVDLGLVVVDEEHDGSYKQSEGGVPYHGRDMAVVLSRQWQAVLVLGSATPSLESLHNVSLGKYQPLHLRHRATGAPLPQVMLVDLRQAVQAGEMTPNSLISPTLHRCMTEELANKRQILLYLDRRGYAPALLCGRCGLSMGCPHCSVSLTYHQTPPRLMCHYCGHVSGVPDYCPRCGQMGFTHFGPGTERLEKKVGELFPEHRVARLDRDVVAAGGKETMQAILAAFERGEVDILVGTRMIAKGHHFPGLSLVGVILAETGLFHPDFRGSERTFQAITQVAGRAGREGSGRVVVQSYDPGNHAITAALSQDGAAFVARELPERREVGYPPYNRLAMVRFLHQDQNVGNQLQTYLRQQWSPGMRGHVLGPAPAHLFRLRGWYRWQVLLRQPLDGNLHGLVQQVVETIAKQEVSGLKLLVDMDPYDFLS